MNKLVSNNIIKRFKILKKGGNILFLLNGKYLTVPSVVDLVEEQRLLINNGVVLPLIDYSKLIVDNSESRRRATQKINKNVKAPMKPNTKSEEIIKMLDELWRAGAFKGIKNRKGLDLTYEQAVDGIEGKWTRLALKNMKFKDALKKSVHTVPNNIDSKLERDSNKIITISGPLIPGQIIDKVTNTPLRMLETMFTKNLYPYDYGLVESEREKYGNLAPSWLKRVAEPIVGKEIMEKYGQNFTDKIWLGMKGSTETNEALKEFKDLDLNNPELRKRALELRPYFTNFNNSSLEQILFSARARDDANSLYLGLPQKYNTWAENQEYNHPKAIELGVPTYTYRDPAMREKQREMARNIGRNKGEGTHSGVTGDAGTVFNHYTVNRGLDGSGYYYDVWDFLGPNLGNYVIMGDTIYSK